MESNAGAVTGEYYGEGNSRRWKKGTDSLALMSMRELLLLGMEITVRFVYTIFSYSARPNLPRLLRYSLF